jgi:4-diphosphocytidyl-2-C-methyl-D-erythritol kinase
VGNLTVWPAPAKINLFLRINGRRPDGYHELSTLFAILDRGDTMTLEPRNDGIVRIFPDMGFPTEGNIIFKAIKLLAEITGKNIGADVHVDKRIPMGGGLGGGSSNAATAMVAINHLMDLGLSEDELARAGRRLGADVPVFVRGRSAYAEGVGEKLTPVAIPEKWYLVVTPENTHVSTREIFTHPDLPRNTPKMPLEDLMKNPRANDCEGLVKKIYPEVATALSWLLKYAPSGMTGTGASCFGEFPDEDTAVQACNSLPDNISGFVARACNVSPLHELLGKLKAAK